MFTNLISRIFGKNSVSHRSTKQKGRRLSLESLENRELLSVSPYNPDVWECKSDFVVKPSEVLIAAELINSDNIAAETASEYTGDLGFYNDPIPFVATTTNASAAATTITADDALYLYFSVVAAGSSEIPYNAIAEIYIDNTFAQSVDVTLKSGFYTRYSDISLDSLTAGEHSIKIILNPSGYFTDTNEGNNETTISITVLESTLGPVAPPTDFQAVIENDKVKLTWTGSSDATYYEIRRKDADGIHWTILGKPTGTTFYDINPPDGQQYYEIRTFRGNAASVASAVNLYVTPGTSRVPQLSSLPWATKTIFLDFDGYISNTNWKGDRSAWDPSNNGAAFSDTELEYIRQIWEMVSEDFAPFEINVTTVDPGVERLSKSGAVDTEWGIRVVFGGTNGGEGWGGIAQLGSFNSASDTPCYVVNAGWKAAALAASHEVGHTLGLSHDGYNNAEYYSINTYWGPLMGAPYSSTLTQWSKGEYDGATQFQDDLAIITGAITTTYTPNGNGFGYRADDHASDILSISNSDILNLDADGFTFVTTTGIIEQNIDIDIFQFSVNAASLVNFNIIAGNSSDANLDILAKLWMADNDPVFTTFTQNNTTTLNAYFTNIELAAGTYYLSIEGTGTDIYSKYGSLGTYTISGTMENVTPSVPADFQEKADAASPDTVTLQWTQSPDATGYNIRYTKTAEIDNDVWISIPCNSSTETTITGLESDTEYTFQIRAVNGSKVSLWSAPITAATQEAPLLLAPATPTNFKVVPSTSVTSIKLTWDAVPNADRYVVQYRTGTNNWTDLPTEEAISGPFVGANGLAAGTTYYFQLKAVNAAGSSAWTDAIQVTREAISTVVTTNLDVVNAYDGFISLREAIQYAQDGETVTFATGLQGQTITLGGNNLIIDKNISIDGTGRNVTVDADGKSRVLYINGSTVSLIGLTITGGYVSDSGAGIANDGGILTIKNSIVKNNTAVTDCGGIWNDGTLTIIDSSITGNTARAAGGIGCGGVGNIVTITNSVISENQSIAGYGAGIFGIKNGANTLFVTNSTISNNSAFTSFDGEGGGISWSGTLVIDNSQIIDNSINSTDTTSYYYTWGGGILIRGDLTITNSTISGNFANKMGGGIHYLGSTATITNSVIAGNSGSSGSGGIYIGSSGIVTITNSTIAGNSGGEINRLASGSLLFYNTIVAGNIQGVASGSNNLVFGSVSGLENNVNGNIVGTSASIAPKFVNYTYYTTWTKDLWKSWDLHLASDSPAINAGSNSLVPTEITTDLAGNARIQGSAVDIGAYEYGSTSVTVPENLRVIQQGQTTLTLDWNDVAGATGYVLQRFNGSNFETVYAGTDSQYVDQNLAAETSYSYRIQAVGSAFSEAVSAKTLPTSISDVPAVTSAKLENGKATLEWANLGTEYTYYIFKNGTLVTQQGQSGTTYTDNNPPTTTKYIVYAYNNLTGDWTKSLPTVLTTAPVKAEFVNHEVTPQGSIKLNWNIPESTQFVVFRNGIPVSGNVSGQTWTDTAPLPSASGNQYVLYVNYLDNEGNSYWTFSSTYVVQKPAAASAASLLDTFWAEYDSIVDDSILANIV